MNKAQRILIANEIPAKHALKRLLKRARQAIQVAATLGSEQTVFEVPSVCIDFPVRYDLAKMVRSIVHYLAREKYTVAVDDDHVLLISWHIKK